MLSWVTLLKVGIIVLSSISPCLQSIGKTSTLNSLLDKNLGETVKISDATYGIEL